MNDEQRQNLMRWRGALRHPSNQARRTINGLAIHDKVCALGLLAETMGLPKGEMRDPAHDHPQMMTYGFRFPDGRYSNSWVPHEWFREVTGQGGSQHHIIEMNHVGFEKVADLVDDWLIDDEIQRWSERNILDWMAERQDVLDG